jgi:putative membrane protein
MTATPEDDEVRMPEAIPVNRSRKRPASAPEVPTPEVRAPEAVKLDVPPERRIIRSKEDEIAEKVAVGTEVVALPAAPPPARRRINIVARVAWSAAGALVALALSLAVGELINALYQAHPILGWITAGVAGILVVALLILSVREYRSLRRLRDLDKMREQAAAALLSRRRSDTQVVLTELRQVYHARSDLIATLNETEAYAKETSDGAAIIRHAETTLIGPLDARAKLFIGASARRVALVTAISPRALVDMSFVAFESVKLAGSIARLYGARPGAAGTARLMAEVIAHLAVTGGLTLADGVLEQVFGHGVAERISSRFGEGLLNGLMTVRVGIAAMRVVRPLPFEVNRQPMVIDYLAELASVTKAAPKEEPDPV